MDKVKGVTALGRAKAMEHPMGISNNIADIREGRTLMFRIGTSLRGLSALLAILFCVPVTNALAGPAISPPTEYTSSFWPINWNGPTNNSDGAHDVVLDKQGNVYATIGTSYGGLYGNYSKGIVRKYSCSGATLWEDIFYNPTTGGNEYASGLALDPTETYLYVVGQILDAVIPGNYQAHLRKYNVNSPSMSNLPIWALSDSGPYDRSLAGPEENNDVAVDSNGFVFTAGGYKVSSMNTNWHVEKRDPSNGSIIWTRTVDGPYYGRLGLGSSDEEGSIAITRDDRVLVGGMLVMSVSSGGAAILEEFDNATGAMKQIWEVDQPPRAKFFGLAVDSIHNILYAATSVINPVTYMDNWQVRKFDLINNEEITKGKWPVTNFIFNDLGGGLQSIAYDSLNDLIIAGGNARLSGDPYVNWRITALTSKGMMAWTSDIIYNTPGSPLFSESIQGITVDCYGNIIAAGYREAYPQNPATGQGDVRIAKYGNGLQCNCEIPPMSSGNQGTNNLRTVRGEIIPAKDAIKLSTKVVFLLISTDPSLIKRFSKFYKLSTTSGLLKAGLFLRTTGGDPGLASYGATDVVLHPNNIIAAMVPLDKVGKIASLSQVLKIEASFMTEPTLDVSMSDIGVTGVRGSKMNNSGSGVVVGDVDTGIDITHSDFQSGPSNTRILSLWDQTLSSCTGSCVGTKASFGYGFVFTQADINSVLPGGNVSIVPSQDTNGHGTHVTSIMAGNGTGSGGTYTGAAPQADIISVKTTFDQSDILNGVQYVFNNRGTKPAVVNLSLGTAYEGHDGQSLFETALDGYVNGQQTIVVASGNDGGQAWHASSNLGGNALSTVDRSFNVPFLSFVYDENYMLDMWFDGPDNYSISVKSPTSGSFVPGNGLWQQSGFDYFCVVSPGPGFNPSGRNEILIQLYNYSMIGGLWQIRITQTGIGPVTGKYDIWTGNGIFYGIGIPPAGFTNNDSNGTLSVPGTASSVITVGAYDTRNTWTSGCTGGNYSYNPPVTVGDISTFSGKGPTRDGRLKPDLTAPGQGIIAALSAQSPLCSSSVPYVAPYIISTPPNGYLLSQGTSMASPQVAGVVALMYSANQSLIASQVKTTVQNTCRRDAFTGGSNTVPNQDNSWGFGKVNALSAVGSVSSASWVFRDVHSVPPPYTYTIIQVVTSPNYSTDGVVFTNTIEDGGLYKSTDGGSSFVRIPIIDMSAGVDAEGDQILAIAVSPNYNETGTDKTIFAATVHPNPVGPDLQIEGRMYKSTDGGQTWHLFENGIPTNPSGPVIRDIAEIIAISPFYHTTDANNTIYAGFMGNGGIMKIPDVGASPSWINTGFIPISGSVNSLMVWPDSSNMNSEVVFAGGPRYLQRTDDGGVNWYTKDTGIPSVNTLNFIALVFASEKPVTSPFKIFVGGGASIKGAAATPILAYSTNKGDTWTSLSLPPSNLIYHVSDLAISPAFAKDRNMFAATIGGVYSSFDAGTSWKLDSAGLPYDPISLAMSDNFPTDRALFAGTLSGLYFDPVAGSCLSSQNMTPITSGYNPKLDKLRIINHKLSCKAFNPSAKQSAVISFELNKATDQFTVVIRNSENKPVRHIVAKNLTANSHSLIWKGESDSGLIVPDGNYRLELTAITKSVLYTYDVVKISVTVGAPNLITSIQGANRNNGVQ